MDLDGLNFDRILELGKELAGHLQANDTLGRWMAHYIAELMERCESATTDRDARAAECADAILKLWAHRSGAPFARTPMQSFEAIYRGLERLDPESSPFYGYGIEPVEDADSNVSDLVRIALGLQTQVRDMVRDLFAEAAATASDQEADWVRVAGDLANDDESVFRRSMIGRLLEGSYDEPTAQTRIGSVVESARTLGATLAGLVQALEPAEDGEQGVQTGD